MGWNLELAIVGARRREIVEFLHSGGFRATQSIAPQPGCSYFYWFEDRDYMSYAGVEATLSSKSARPEPNQADSTLAVHCKIWASVHDVGKMNEVIRTARKAFGGKLDGDYGKNRYIPLWDDSTTQLSRGVIRTYDRSLEVLETLKFAVPEEIVRLPGGKDGTGGDARFIELVQQLDPARVVYNGLVPMLVAVLENYYSRLFLVLARCDAGAQTRVREARISRGLSGDDLLRLASGELRPEAVLAREFSFQNLDILTATFKRWFDLDIKSILGPPRRIQGKTDSLLNSLSRLIEYRHDVVHGLRIDRSLSRDGLVYWIDVAARVIEETTMSLGRKYGFSVERIL